MSPTEIAFFSVTLFLALVALLQWKRRRMIARERVSRGLKGYVANRTVAGSKDHVEEQDGESLAIVQ